MLAMLLLPLLPLALVGNAAHCLCWLLLAMLLPLVLVAAVCCCQKV